MSLASPAISVQGISHRYGERQALDGVTFAVAQGEIYGLLGPNGGGKTTLFHLLSTLLTIQSGSATIGGSDVASQPSAVRSIIGVTFQSPSLDAKLRVAENLKHHGRLYGFSGSELTRRIEEQLTRLGVADRAKDTVGTLSGGLKRRVEIAKGLLHAPSILLLDEPSTGLDPGARHDLWTYLTRLRDESQVTILVTTHLMEEAEHCDRLGILDRGKLVIEGTPDALRATVGGDTLMVSGSNLESLSGRITQQFGVTPSLFEGKLRIEHARGHELLRDLIAAFPEDIRAVTFGKPSLEDVFIHHTGHQFWDEAAVPAKSKKKGARH
jgi:ABC-2 type transport system ATP-binding protein